MALSLSNSLFLLLILSLFLANTVHSQQDVTSFQIDSFKPTTAGLTYERDAFVASGSSYLSLVATDASGKPQTSSVGRVLYSKPIKFGDEGRQASFETTIRLAVSPINNDPADGMTFFIVPVNSTKPTGGEGGSLGIFNAVTGGSPIFAIEFDTYVNSPGDPNFRHIGININSQVSQNVTNFQDAIGQTVYARINYDAPTRRITVDATYGSQTSTVDYVYDLKTLLPQQVQVGLSASTGPTLVSNFKVFSWYFTSTMVVDKNNFINQDQETTYIKQVAIVQGDIPLPREGKRECKPELEEAGCRFSGVGIVTAGGVGFGGGNKNPKSGPRLAMADAIRDGSLEIISGINLSQRRLISGGSSSAIVRR
ncbi:hypothetical protein ACS0TY_007217 [Phlomoides rotata]